MSIDERPYTILVVDDDEKICRALKTILSTRNYGVIIARSAQEAMDRIAEHTPDLMILDLTMPGTSGLELCRELRTWLDIPMCILSARVSESDKIAALDFGADDYLTKPFSAGELLARIRALRRRAAARVVEPTVNTGELSIDLARRMVLRNNTRVDLTPTEFEILAILVRNANCVVTTKMLIEFIWGPDYEDSQALRVHVSHLRKKIEPHSAVPRHIITEPGVGFRFVLPE